MDVGDALQLLADPYRCRLVLTSLEHNLEDESDISAVMADDAEEFEELSLKMYHHHLPKLEKAGVIEWDRNENVVRKGPTFEELVPLLRLIDDHQEELPGGWL
ncbi:DUF7344 domain-containing protein [Halocatena marina]|uniref:DUF7344 domain-containing protein n=1 Tax=Halocatena marina TaxID=2934937 RepID=UPI00200D5A87|nr:transcriptional regulator [Halocatena marina]